MDDIFNGLDDQQIDAVKHTLGPGLIIAGAGSGKTTTLVRRTCQLIASGENPSGILLLTFTRNAARAIISRAKGFQKEAERVQGGTFHSIAYKLIKENHEIFDLPQNFTIIDPDDTHLIIKQFADEYAESKKVLPTANFVQTIISFSKNTQRDIKEIIDTLHPEQADNYGYVIELMASYEECKKKNFLLDYDDLLIFWAELANNSGTRKALCERFPHVMIDEHQDSNKLQLKIIYGLKDCKSIVACGDPSQSIYKFRGSAPETMFDFLRTWPETKKYLLENNYRSTDKVIDLANSVDSKMKNRFERKLIPHKTSEILPQLITVRNRHQEAQEVCDAVARRSNQGITLDKQAILIRSQYNVRHIEAELMARKIPYMFLGGLKLAQTSHIKDLLSVLRIGNNPKDLVSWSRFLECLPKVGKKTSKSLVDEIMKLSNLDEVISFFKTLSKNRKNLTDVISILDVVKSPWRQCLSKIIEVVEPMLIHKYKDEYKWRKNDLLAIIDMATGYDDLESFINNLQLEMNLDKKITQEECKKDDALLTVSTIHSAKGLEWESVLIPSFVSGHLPSNYAVLEEDKEEEKRLMYVAVTRAKTYLDFYKPLSVGYGDREILAEDSPFENYIRDYVKNVSKQDIPGPDSYRLNSKYKLSVR